MNIIIIFILMIFTAFLIPKYWDFKMIIFKNFFRLQKFSDFLQIIAILVLFAWFVLITTLMSMPHGCSVNPRLALSKTVSVLNQVITMNKQIDGKDASNCVGCNSNKQALANFFMKRLNLIDYNSVYYKKSYNKFSKDNLFQNPHFITNDGMLYIIEKSQGKCGNINTTDPDKANCVMIIDINGDKSPNQFSTGNKKDKNYKIKDRFRLIILKNKIVPASNKENDVANYILNR